LLSGFLRPLSAPFLLRLTRPLFLTPHLENCLTDDKY
jgi:hypothetical protein